MLINMKNTDFRIGNFIQPPSFVKFAEGNNGEAVVTEISANGIIKTLTAGHIESGPITEPIPIRLTHEWLLKFGWVWNERTNSYENADTRMHLEYRPLNGSYKMFNYVLRALICERIWHVHELQNLCFALTGEELKYNNL